MKRTRFAPLLFVVVLLTLVGACGPTPTPAPQAQATAAPTAVPERKVATFIWTQEFDTLNPLYTNMWFSAITLQIWNCYAWDFDDENAPYPVLVKEMPSAENGGISADGKTITLKLRDDIVWSDGTPITSADFAFTHQMILDPNNAVASTYPNDQLEALETPDAQTVVMKFSEPFAPWMGTFWHGLLPAHIVQPMYEAAGTLDTIEWNRAPKVSCGPFVFDTWESGSYARFVANDKYWLGRPKIDEIFVRFVPDDAAQVAALKAGDGDLGTFIAYPDMPPLEEAGVNIVWSFSGYNEGIYFYLGEDAHPALQDVNVRKAIALGTDRFSLCEDLLLGRTAPAATYWDGTPWVDPTIEPYPYDPEQAKTLLDAAGWIDSNNDGVRDKDGVELVLDYGTTTREVRVDTQAILQQQLAAIGIKVNLLNYDSTIYFGSYAEGGPCATGELDMFEYSTVVNFPDPDTSEWYCDQIPSDESPDGTNWMAVCDPALEDLFKLETTQVDFAARQATFYQITRYIFDNVYWLGLWLDPDSFAIGPRLLNVKISGATPFFNIAEWDIK
jgi:peptide/nickel transport system substrate-binding protein